MEGFIGRRDLLTREQLQSFSVRSDARGAGQLASHLMALTISTTLLATLWGTWWTVPCFLIQGALLNWLYCGQHELSHGTVFKTRWLNEWAGRVIGFLQLYPRDFDQIQHFGHHRHTGDWEKDPELLRDPYELQSYLLWFSGISYWHSRLTRLVRLTRGRVVEPYVRDDEKELVIREARWHVTLYGMIVVLSIVFQSWVAFALWLGPMCATKWAYMLQGTIKHLGRPHSDNLFENTRTARTGMVFHWLGWNMQYHTAHHLFPSVPFHRLPELHQAIIAKAGVEPPTMGYFEFQREVIAKLTRGREVTDYPDDGTWIGAATTSSASDASGHAEA
jgi:fatty acid desaturase